ncbi:UNVERIFIED_CONTAM: hypothetical protein GTU68_015594 [Idotea baltica]|nr:hypothetical protein [Idotea baltica]
MLDQAVVTIPANSRGRARMLTKISAGLAGIEVAALINEPTAAAMAYGRRIKDGERVLVYDWGGGTLDVTILRRENGVFMERASKGIQQLGGIDLDRAIAELLKGKIDGSHNWQSSDDDAFLLDVERAKVILSDRTATNVSIPGGSTIEITRDDLNVAIRPFVERSREPVDKCLADLGASAPIHHVVLVGGSSKIPAVRDYVSELMGIAPMDGVDPMTAVAEGAALAAAILNGEVHDYDFFVSTEHALGTIVVDADTGEERFSVLIPRNNMLPANRSDSYTPALDHQESVLVRVIEGDPDQPLSHDDNVILKDWDIKLAEPRPRADASISITYHYDVDGILRVVVHDDKTSEVLLDEELAFAPDRKRQLNRMRQQVVDLVGDSVAAGSATARKSVLDRDSQELVDKAEERIIPFVGSEEAERLTGIIIDLRNSDHDQLEENRRRLGAAIREHAYLL